MKKQFIAKLLVLAMVLSMVPVTILAAGAAENPTAGSTNRNYGYNYGYYSVAHDTTVNEPITDSNITLRVIGGVAVKNFGDKATASLWKLAEDGAITLTINAPGAERITLGYDAKALTKAALKSGANLVLPDADGRFTITIPNSALTTLFKDAKLVKIAIQMINGENTVVIRVDGVVVEVEGLVVTWAD